MVNQNKDGIYFEVEPMQKSLGQNFKILTSGLSDLRPLFEQLSSDFYKDEKRIFQLQQGPGKYEDLSDRYEQQKLKRWGHIYPILFASGRLASSLLSRSAIDSVNIIKKDSMLIGTSTPYAVYHHSSKPRSVIPLRPIWFFGESNQPLTKRWKRTIDKYIEKLKDGAFKNIWALEKMRNIIY